MDEAKNYLRERAADIRGKGHTLTAQMHENIADYIALLEAVVRAVAASPVVEGPGEVTIEIGRDTYAKCREVLAAYCRARVNLPDLPDSSVNPPPLTSQSQAEGVDGKEASDGN